MIINVISAVEVHFDRDDGAKFQAVLDGWEWYLAKAGNADIEGYFPTLAAAEQV